MFGCMNFKENRLVTKNEIHVQVYNWTYIGTQLGVHRGKIVRVQGDITFASLPNADPAPNFG